MAIEKQKSLSLSLSFWKRNPFSCAFTLYACNKGESMKTAKNHKKIMNVDSREGAGWEMHMNHHTMEETEHVEWTHSVLSFVCAS